MKNDVKIKMKEILFPQAFAPLHPRLRELDFKRLLRMKEERPTDEKLAFLRAQRLIDAGMALASATFQVHYFDTFDKAVKLRIIELHTIMLKSLNFEFMR